MHLPALLRASLVPLLSLGLVATASAAEPVSPLASPLAAPPAAQPASGAAPASGPAPVSPFTAPVDDAPALLKTSFRLNNPAKKVAFFAYAEVGAIGFLKHTFQLGKDGTQFDFKGEGNQSTMFLFARLSAELELWKRHSFIFVYQPIDIRTETVLRRDVTLDRLVFPAGTPLDLRYGFDFYRLSYQVDIFKSPRYELAFGVGAQLRNAKIVFTSADGRLRRLSDDLGVVPLLRVRGRYTFNNGVWLGLEADGIYANVKYLNGGQSDVEGALLDASLRVGMTLTSFMDVFLNLRYLGGGASGTSKTDAETGPGDGYTDNWLHTLALSIGFGVR